MKAAIYDEFGSAQVIKTVDDFPKPKISDGKVLVEVEFAGINPIDYKIREGAFQKFMPITLPKVIGMDLSGTVVEVSADSDLYKVGDKVYGQADFFASNGSMAEFSDAKLTSLSLIPESIEFDEAAALPLVAVSAYQGLIDNMGLKSGQKVLIHGAAGGIGSIAIQIAKHLGAYVATTSAAKDIDYVKSLGSDEAIDYASQDFSEILKDFDGVLDVIGGEVYKNSFKVLKSGGVIVSLSSEPDSELSEKYNVNARHQGTQVNHESLDNISKLIEAGAIEAQIEKSFSIDEARQAFEYAENEHPRGKIVVRVKKA